MNTAITYVEALLKTMIFCVTAILVGLLVRAQTPFVPTVCLSGALIAFTLAFQFLVSGTMRQPRVPTSVELARSSSIAIPFFVGYLLLIGGLISILIEIV